MILLLLTKIGIFGSQTIAPGTTETMLTESGEDVLTENGETLMTEGA